MCGFTGVKTVLQVVAVKCRKKRLSQAGLPLSAIMYHHIYPRLTWKSVHRLFGGFGSVGGGGVGDGYVTGEVRVVAVGFHVFVIALKD